MYIFNWSWLSYIIEGIIYLDSRIIGSCLKKKKIKDEKLIKFTNERIRIKE